MDFLRTHKGKVTLAVLVIGVLLAWFSGRVPHETSPVPQDKPGEQLSAGRPAAAAPSFDFYLLALTLHPAFCAERRAERECRAGTHRPLVIHGLWPERLEPRTYPHDCPAPPLQLDPDLERRLADFMPGMASGLHQHEWREHGGCSGLDDDVYFSRTLDLARELDSALGEWLTTVAGRESTPQELRAAADQRVPGSGATFTLHCRDSGSGGRRPVLLEVRQCVDNDGPGGAPGTALDCATVRRRDQGCGASFRILGGDP